MKISDLKNDQIAQFISQGNKSAPAEKAQGPREEGKAGVAGDRVEISRESRDLQRIREVLAQTPDVRAGKVAALKKAIAEGRYQVSAEEIAAKMVRQILVESGKE
jgi:negative regulator of flagellin synthesis FlgM